MSAPNDGYITTNPILLQAQKERQDYDDLVTECATLAGMGEVALEDRFFEWLAPTKYGFLDGIRAFRETIQPTHGLEHADANTE